MLKYVLTCCLSFFYLPVFAQLCPLEGRELNYRIIGFSDPAACNDCLQQVEIAVGHFDNQDSFSHHLLQTYSSKGRVIGEVPFFGTEYTWRVESRDKTNTLKPNSLHHFKTGTSPVTDTANFRLLVDKNSSSIKDVYFFLDGNKGLYDINGQLIWYLPVIDSIDYGTVTDLKVSPTGTITLLYNDKNAYEINYDGKILWSGLNNNKVDRNLHYHHELTKLSNGHYMVFSVEEAYICNKKRKETEGPLYNFSTDGTIQPDDEELPVAFPFGTLDEYSKSNQLVWQWKFADYFQHSDLMYGHTAELKKSYDSHPNSFYFDEATKHIYISMRNISRVLKIDYKSKKVLATYGQLYKKGVNIADTGLFTGQHSVGLSQEGYLTLFNNNAGHPDQPPYGVMFKEKGGNVLENVWRYDCFEVTPVKERRIAYNFSRGGNMVTLPNGNIFIANCSPACNIFIVDRNKNVLWSAQPEAWSVFDKKWVTSTQYKPSLVNGKEELEKMIWNTEQALH